MGCLCSKSNGATGTTMTHTGGGGGDAGAAVEETIDVEIVQGRVLRDDDGHALRAAQLTDSDLKVLASNPLEVSKEAAQAAPSSAPGTPLGRLAACEETLLGAAGTGAMLPRLQAIEEAALGAAGAGAVPDRIAAVEAAIGLAAVSVQSPHAAAAPPPPSSHAASRGAFAPEIGGEACWADVDELFAQIKLGASIIAEKRKAAIAYCEGEAGVESIDELVADAREDGLVAALALPDKKRDLLVAALAAHVRRRRRSRHHHSRCRQRHHYCAPPWHP